MGNTEGFNKVGACVWKKTTSFPLALKRLQKRLSLPAATTFVPTLAHTVLCSISRTIIMIKIEM